MGVTTATLYAAKGGQGCTATAVALALLVGRTRRVVLTAHDPDELLAVAGRAHAGEATTVPLGLGVNLEPAGPQPPDTIVIADAGPTLADPSAGDAMAGAATYLVTRPCFLALRAAAGHPVHPTGVILVDEPGRAIRVDDVEGVLHAPVVATVPVAPEIARTIDAGLLATLLPKPLVRALRPLADTLTTSRQRIDPSLAPAPPAPRRSGIGAVTGTDRS